jgi:hypothetical protein
MLTKASGLVRAMLRASPYRKASLALSIAAALAGLPLKTPARPFILCRLGGERRGGVTVIIIRQPHRQFLIHV